MASEVTGLSLKVSPSSYGRHKNQEHTDVGFKRPLWNSSRFSAGLLKSKLRHGLICHQIRLRKE